MIEPGPGLEIRRLEPCDAAAYRAFRLRALQRWPSAFTSTFADEQRKPVSWAVTRLAAPGRPHDRVLGAFGPSLRLIGIAGLSVPQRRQEAHRGTLFGMAVDPRVSRSGIGRALVEKLLDEARAAGLLQVTLTVSEDNEPAQGLYRACGFETWGREPRAVIVDGLPVAKLHMTRYLDR